MLFELIQILYLQQYILARPNHVLTHALGLSAPNPETLYLSITYIRASILTRHFKLILAFIL